jgi:hypothetical protein
MEKILKFNKFTEKINEYQSYSEPTVIDRMKEKYDFVQIKSFKQISVDNNTFNEVWNICTDKGLFYDTAEENDIFFIYPKDDGESDEQKLVAYYVKPKTENDYGYIVDDQDMEYDFVHNHSFLKLFQKFQNIL